MDRIIQFYHGLKALVADRTSGGYHGIQNAVSGVTHTKVLDFDSFKDTFSPSRIFAQIVILQCVYYITATVMFSAIASLAGYPFSFSWIFSWEPIAFDNALGLTLTVCWLIDSLFCIGFMTIIVGRSKLAWDFAVTIHLINFIVCWIYSGKFPRSFSWWVLQVISSVILVSLGTWTSRWRELRDTFFDGMNDAELGQNTGSSQEPAESIQLNEISK